MLAGLAVLSLLPWLQARPVTSFVIASALIVVQAWFKRFLIVVPVMENPFITEGNAALSLYRPTWVEWAITAGAMAGFLLIYFLLSRLVPIVSVWETAHAKSAETVAGPAHSPLPVPTSSPEV